MQKSYIKLLGLILGSAIAFLIAVAAIFFLLRFSSAMFDKIPWAPTIYIIILLLLVPVVFGLLYYYLIRRSLRHPSKLLGIISATLFGLAFITLLITLGRDFMFLTKGFQPDINKYWTYEIFFLVGHGFLIFLLVLIQAAALPEEQDWIDKYRKENPPAEQRD